MGYLRWIKKQSKNSRRNTNEETLMTEGKNYCKHPRPGLIRDCLQVSPLILTEFKRIKFYPPLKSSENRRFSDDLRGKRS